MTIEEARPLAGRRVLVTGGSKGIGAAIVRAVHRDGAAVAIHFNSDEHGARGLAAELGERAHLVRADLACPGTAAGLWASAQEALGGVDTLINNAGAWIASPAADPHAWGRGWEANLQLNLISAADLCRCALEEFPNLGGGTIVNITSRSAHRGDDAEHLAYGAAKGGLLSLTKGIARGFGNKGILAYAVAPGWVDTGLASGEIDAGTLADLPLREVTPPEDVAELVAFLVSGRSRHLTGATLDITGADYVR
ncbi:SDR family NAD(P)-dependent oxidoreductase [Brevibacterium aurantiacum]|uniref:SDR family oxidoreductase n=1 Tax=Brevibacterium aurantiacum TaxID=273384 RepID=A0A556CQG6_BREAU|nr:SDR family oxidoreductase [Brevibacterium aurantiacum]TSI19669.1 SDR family oxidoreductase [Brevibacterium aurantiacum]